MSENINDEIEEIIPDEEPAETGPQELFSADDTPQGFSDAELFSAKQEPGPASDEDVFIEDPFEALAEQEQRRKAEAEAGPEEEKMLSQEIQLPEGIFDQQDYDEQEAPARPHGKKIMFAAIAVAAVAAVILIIVLSMRKEAPESAEPEAVPVATEEVSVDRVRHLSFPQLSLGEGEGRLSVNEFLDILNDLNEKYTLIDFYSMADVAEDGTITLKDTVTVPEGREPLIISQRDVSFPLDKAGNGYAERLVVTDDGELACEYTDDAGNTYTGDTDLIPVLESFIEENPLFSYDGAKGIIALTGYNGILGYRTSSYLSSQEDNPYGIFDTANEISAAAPVVEKLKQNGWRFASYGFDSLSYGAEYSMVESDVAKWIDQVADLIGGSDMLIFPKQTDIGSWAPYLEANRKFALLEENGFRYFFINETETPWMLQSDDSFIRQGIFEINTYKDYETARELF